MFCHRFSFHKGRGVYGLERWFYRFFGQRSLVYGCPKSLNRASESPWNSASFGIKFNKEKLWHRFPIGATRAKKQGKIIQNRCERVFCSSFFIVNTQTWSETNSIFELSTKSCTSSGEFQQKKKFFKNRPRGPQASTKKTEAEGEYREFPKKNTKKNFHEKS